MNATRQDVLPEHWHASGCTIPEDYHPDDSDLPEHWNHEMVPVANWNKESSMILSHFTERRYLPGLFTAGIKPTGRAPIAVDRFVYGVVWFIRMAPDWINRPGLDGLPDEAVIRVEFPDKSLSRKLVRWERKMCPELPESCFDLASHTFFYKGGIEPARFLDVFDLAGNRIHAADVAGEPLIEPPKFTPPDGQTYVDMAGRDITEQFRRGTL